MKHCNERGIGIVPQGGNTGLVGGGVPIHDELILSLGNMNKVRSFDPVSGLSFRLSFPPPVQVPSVWGPVPRADDPYQSQGGAGKGCCVIQ